LKSEPLDPREPRGDLPMMLGAKQGRDDMTGEPRGVYRTLGTDEKPNSALVESGTLGFEVSEQEYRDQGYKPEFDDLPCGSASCATEMKDGQARPGVKAKSVS
jgi:hypothetical protein